MYKDFIGDDEVKLAVAPCGSSEKNCCGWEGVSIFRSVCADRPQDAPRGATASFTSSSEDTRESYRYFIEVISIKCEQLIVLVLIFHIFQTLHYIFPTSMSMKRHFIVTFLHKLLKKQSWSKYWMIILPYTTCKPSSY